MTPTPVTRDPMHTPWAYPLNDAPQLPLTGEFHPLRREFTRWLGWANGAALVLGLLLFGLWALLNSRKPDAPVMREVKIVRYTELGVPPSLSKPMAPQVQVDVAKAVARAVKPPTIAVPEPVPDAQAENKTIATQEEASSAVGPMTGEDLGTGSPDGTGTATGPVAVETGPVEVEHEPSPDEFVAVEEDPVRIRIDNPVYPDMARAAGVEGTVLVNALLGKDGRVKKTIVVDGPEMLKEAAQACARTAHFKPALLQRKPVEVWVMIPVTFKLH